MKSTYLTRMTKKDLLAHIDGLNIRISDMISEPDATTEALGKALKTIEELNKDIYVNSNAVENLKTYHKQNFQRMEADNKDNINRLKNKLNTISIAIDTVAAIKCPDTSLDCTPKPKDINSAFYMLRHLKRLASSNSV